MWRRIPVMLLLAVAAMFPASPARAGTFEITPYYGYRLGGEFTDFSTTGVDNIEVEDSDAWGIILTFNINPASQVEFQYSRQSTSLVGSGFVFIPSGSDLLDLDVDNWLLGWTYTAGDPKNPARPFGGVCLGVTDFEPSTAGYQGDAQFAFGIYGGVKLAMAKHLGLRLQAQWVSTWVGSGQDVFCDPFGFCYTVSNSSYLNQVELAAGFAIKF